MNALRTDFPVTAEVERIGRAIAAAGGRPILVGGWVRDCLLGHPHSKDFDIEVFALSTKALQQVLSAFGPLHTVGRHFGVLKLSTRAAEYDISVPRRESKIGKGHREFEVVADPGMSFEQAAARRDFTINSIGYAFLERETLDPFDGQGDLRRRVLRHTGPAFGEDPLRVLRAMQFAGRFGMTIAEETIRICREQDLSELPHERIWEEFRKLLLHSDRPAHGLHYAGPLGVLPYFPELDALARLGELSVASERFDAWRRTLAVVDRAALQRATPHRGSHGGPGEAPPRPTLQPGHDGHGQGGHGQGGQGQGQDKGNPMRGHPDKSNMVLMLAALTHLIGAPALARSAAPAASPIDPADLCQAAQAPLAGLMERLTREHGVTDQVWALLRDLPAPERLHARALASDAAGVDAEIRRLALRVPIPALLRLARARHEAAHAGARQPAGMEPSPAYTAGDWLAARARNLGVYDRPPVPFLKGRHLLELGLRPGPDMGRILDAGFEQQLAGALASLDDALRWADREIRARQGA